GVAFVDLVCEGRTFGNIAKLLRLWTEQERLSWNAVRARVAWVCVVQKGAPDEAMWEPRTSRWTREVPRERIRCLSLDWKLWRYFGEEQPKRSDSLRPGDWGLDRVSSTRAAAEIARLEANRMSDALVREGES